MQPVQALRRVLACCVWGGVASFGACTSHPDDSVPKANDARFEAADADSSNCADVIRAYESCEADLSLEACLDPRDERVRTDQLAACCATTPYDTDPVCSQLERDCGDEVGAFEHCVADLSIGDCLDSAPSNESVDPYRVHACCESVSFEMGAACQLIDSTCQAALDDPESDAKLVQDCCEKPSLSDSQRCQAIESTCEATLDDFEACDEDFTVEACLTGGHGDGSSSAEPVHGCCARRDLADSEVCTAVGDACRGALVELGACAMNSEGADCLSDSSFVEACCTEPTLSGTEVCQFVLGGR